MVAAAGADAAARQDGAGGRSSTLSVAQSATTMASTASVATPANLGLRQNGARQRLGAVGRIGRRLPVVMEQAERLVQRRQPGRLRGQGGLHRGELAPQAAAAADGACGASEPAAEPAS